MKRSFLVLVILALAAVFALDGFAQTRKKTAPRKPRRTIPVTTQQIIQQAEPEIISQSEPLPIENPMPVVTETPLQPENTAGNSESFQERIDQFSTRIKEMSTRIGSLESSRRGDLDEKQRRLLLNLEILSRAEQRAETLREKMFALTEKENSLKSELEQVEYDSQDDVLNRNLALVGGMRPEELREQKRRSLQNKKTNINSLIQQIQATKVTLEENVAKADLLVEKLRMKLEKDIDSAINEIEPK